MSAIYPSKQIMTAEEYHAHEAVGSTSLRTIIQKSPAHYLHNLKNPPKSTPAKDLGTLIHTATLERAKFDETSIVMPDFGDMRSPKNREKRESWVLDNHGKLILDQDQMDIINGISAILALHKTAMSYLCEGRAEESLFCIDPETKIPIKARMDFKKDSHILIDLKTTEDCSFRMFQKTVIKYDYHIQAAMYLDVASEVYDTKFDQFVIIAVEKKPPYAVNCFILTDETLAEGRAQYQQALKILKKCRETGIYPAYTDDTKPMWLPAFALRSEDNE